MDKKETNYLELPVTGLHLGGAAKVLYHEPPKRIIQRWTIDKHAYFAQRDEVRKFNAVIWEDSVTKLPAELYSRYRVSKGIESFRSLTNEMENANLKVRDGVTGNTFWAQDAAQVVQGLGRMVDREALERAVVEVGANYADKWKRQLGAFSKGKVQPPNDKVYEVFEKSQAVEQYDKFMRLMYIFPTISAAADFNNTTAANIDDAAKRHRTFNNNYFRYYYDNGFVALNNLVAEQLLDGEPINRFPSIKEASLVLGIPTYTIYRLLRNPTSIDKYGCTWRRLPKN